MYFNNEIDSNSNSDNDDYETIPDEEFIKSQKPRGKLISWPNTKTRPTRIRSSATSAWAFTPHSW